MGGGGRVSEWVSGWVQVLYSSNNYGMYVWTLLIIKRGGGGGRGTSVVLAIRYLFSCVFCTFYFLVTLIHALRGTFFLVNIFLV